MILFVSPSPTVHIVPITERNPANYIADAKMDRLVQAVFVSDSRVTCREIRKFGTLQIAPDDPLDRKVSAMQSERGLERPFPIWETMARKVGPFVLAKFFNDPINARFFSIYAHECGETDNALTNVVQFYAYGKEFALASSSGLTDGKETFLFSCRIS